MSLTQLKWIFLTVALALYTAGVWKAGADSVQAQWDREKAEANAQAAQALQEAQDKVREAEQRASAVVSQIDAQLTKEKRERRNAEAAALNRAHDGGLYIDAACPNDNNSVPDAPGSTGAGDGKTRAKLSGAAGEFLVRLAAEADEVVAQLQACQQLLEAERK